MEFTSLYIVKLTENGHSDRIYLLKLSHFIVPLALLLSILTGCTSLTPSPDESADKVSTAEPATKSTDEARPAAAAETLPNIELTDEIFFKVVSSEIAFQRGDFAAAYATIMALAQQTRDPRLPKRALEMALIAKQPPQAFLASRFWYEYAPDSLEAMQYYLGFLILNNDNDEVKKILSNYLETLPPKERGTTLLQIERLVMRGSNKDASFGLLEEIYQPYPDYLETHLALAQAAYSMNNNVRAMLEARAALKITPSSQIAILTVAQVSPSQEEALSVLANFLTQYPAAFEVRRAYGGMLIEQKQYAQARSQFETLLADRPNDTGFLYTLGVLSLQINDTASAEKNLKAFVEAIDASGGEKGDATTAYQYLSQIADERNDGVTAIEWLKKIKSYEGKNAAYFNAQLRLAVLMAKYQSLEKARDFLHTLTANHDEAVQVVQLEAELLRNADHDEESRTLLKEAVKNYPDNPDLLYDYAMAMEKIDRIDEMEKALRHVIEISPDNQHAYNALGYSLADRNIRLPEARVLIEKALSIAPDDAFIIDSIGWLEFRENKAESALTHLQRAYALRPDADIAVHVGEVLWSLGNQEKALAVFREAQQKDPKNSALKSTLERLKISL